MVRRARRAGLSLPAMRAALSSRNPSAVRSEARTRVWVVFISSVLSMVWVGGPTQARRPQWWRAERRVCREVCHRGARGRSREGEGDCHARSGMRVRASECGRSALVRRVTAVKSRCGFRTANCAEVRRRSAKVRRGCAEVRASSRPVHTISAAVQRAASARWQILRHAACAESGKLRAASGGCRAAGRVERAAHWCRPAASPRRDAASWCSDAAGWCSGAAEGACLARGAECRSLGSDRRAHDPDVDISERNGTLVVRNGTLWDLHGFLRVVQCRLTTGASALRVQDGALRVRNRDVGAGEAIVGP